MNNSLVENNISSMIKKYSPNGYDWMGNPISKDNPLTIYYLQDFDYEALLTRKSYLELYELLSLDKDLFDEWQWLFYAINYSDRHPSYAYQEMIDELKTQTDELVFKRRLN